LRGRRSLKVWRRTSRRCGEKKVIYKPYKSLEEERLALEARQNAQRGELQHEIDAKKQEI
jgi:hypothetical protein